MTQLYRQLVGKPGAVAAEGQIISYNNTRQIKE